MRKSKKLFVLLVLLFLASQAVCWASELDLSGMTDQQILQRILQNSEMMQNLSTDSLSSQKNVQLQFTTWEQRLQTVEQNLTNQSLLQNEFSSSMKKTANSFQNLYEDTQSQINKMQKQVKVLKISLGVTIGICCAEFLYNLVQNANGGH